MFLYEIRAVIVGEDFTMTFYGSIYDEYSEEILMSIFSSEKYVRLQYDDDTEEDYDDSCEGNSNFGNLVNQDKYIHTLNIQLLCLPYP